MLIAAELYKNVLCQQFFQVNALRFLTSTTALAILWLLSLSAFLAIPIPCLVPIGKFFFDGVL